MMLANRIHLVKRARFAATLGVFVATATPAMAQKHPIEAEFGTRTATVLDLGLFKTEKYMRDMITEDDNLKGVFSATALWDSPRILIIFFANRQRPSNLAQYCADLFQRAKRDIGWNHSAGTNLQGQRPPDGTSLLIAYFYSSGHLTKKSSAGDLDGAAVFQLNHRGQTICESPLRSTQVTVR